MDMWWVAPAALAVGFVLGVVGVGWALRGAYAARLASARTEADLLRERVVDLEVSVSEDSETAALLAPLREALGRVETQVGVLERDRVQQFGSLKAVLTRVESETADLGRATASLAGSLRSSNVRGAWGEVQLRRVLEAAGMLARCDFSEQVQATNHHGQVVKPDVVVHLPGDKHLVIDAKAPMSAFLEAQAEDCPGDERAEHLRAHAKALRSHVAALAGKDYWSAFEQSPELVVCFVPMDSMLAAALDADPSLHEWAFSQRVVLTGPATLLALVRTVALGWQQESLAQNAAELMALGRDLHARLATLGGHVSKVGRSLQSSVESYNAMVGTLEGRVLVTARRLHDLGLVSEPLPTAAPVESTPRVLTAYELIEAATGEESRPELDLGFGGGFSPAAAAEPAHRPA